MEPISPNFDVNTTLGALEIGILVSYVLFGVTTTQTYIYYGRFPDDSRGVKFLVALVWSCEVAHLICIGQPLYHATISDFENPQRILLVPTAVPISFLFSSITGTCVQGFFSFRIYRLSKSLYIPAFSWMLSFLRVAFAILAVIYEGHSKVSIFTFEAQRAWILYIVWGASMVNDLIIAATLVYWLYQQRINAQMKTLALVDKLIEWTIETGVVSWRVIYPFRFLIFQEPELSTATTLASVFYLTMKDNFIWVAVYTVISNLYANSLLASLNSRATLRAMDELEITLPHSAPATGSTPGNINFAVSRSTYALDALAVANTPAGNMEITKISYVVD
ncbi:hypothetical protein C8R44DRAFT_982724 [Mycena epipterygia]|nr:hypothetical protein C8R44DRAFT_982724 [Mycena epipterygia]